MPNNGMMSFFDRPRVTDGVEDRPNFSPFQRYRGADEVKRQGDALASGRMQPVNPVRPHPEQRFALGAMQPEGGNVPPVPITRSVVPQPVPGVPVPPPAIQPGIFMQQPVRAVPPVINRGSGIDRQGAPSIYQRPIDYSLTRMNREMI